MTGEAVVPQAVQASSSDADSQAANLIDPSTLRDRDGDGLEEHGTSVRQMWLSAAGQPQGWVEFDFGAPQKLSTMCVWNFNDTWRTNRGVQKADVSVWTQDGGWRKVRENVALEQAEGSEDYDEPTVVTLDSVTAQKVRLENLVSLGAADCVGLSAVRFCKPRGPEAVQPDPLSGTTAGVNELALGWTAGEGAKAHNVYLGEKADDLKLLGKVEQPGAKIARLNPDTKYYWRVDEVLADGSTAPGRIWNFTTGRLAGWWKLDEAEGTKVADSSGNGHDGVIHGDPKWLPAGGKVGGALQFDGVDDYVDTDWTEDLPTWTVAVWVTSPAAPTSTPGCGPVHREANFQLDWNHDWDPYRSSAALRVGDTWHGASFGELKGNTWYHLVATYDGETLKAYKDAVLITSNPRPSGPPFHAPETMKIGRNAANPFYFAGTVDQLCVFTSALGADEIKSLYSGKEPSAIASQPSAAGPHLVQMASAASVEPAAAVPAPTAETAPPPQPQVQPAGAEASGPQNAAPQPARRSRNILAVVVIVAAVGLIAGASTVGRRKMTNGE